MQQTVYVDILFLVNTSMDFLCFFLCSAILGDRLRPLRSLLASALGGSYTICVLLHPASGLLGLLLDAAVCLVMCMIVYGGAGKWRRIPLYSALYFAISMALGGFMTALYHMLNRLSLPIVSGGDAPSVSAFFLLALGGGVLTLLGGRLFRRRSAVRHCTLSLSYGGRRLSLTALVDSGNLWRDPVSGKPCIVVESEALSPLLPIRPSGNAVQTLSRLPPREAARFRLIPVRTATGEAVLLGLRPDTLAVDGRETDALVVMGEVGGADEARALVPASLLL